jgi:Fe-S cluster biogenesis protein NfuA
MNECTVFFEATPNPQTLKFIVSRNIASESTFFENAEQTQRSPLAQKIFGFPWTQAVFIGPNFISITKQDWVDWDILADPLCDLIKEHFDRGLSAIVDLPDEEPSAENPARTIQPGSLEERIHRFIEDNVRPAVAMDGGDIIFDRFDGGIVYLHLRGACSGCPSSMITLKDGIEYQLKQAIPEVVEVVAV